MLVLEVSAIITLKILNYNEQTDNDIVNIGSNADIISLLAQP